MGVSPDQGSRVSQPHLQETTTVFPSLQTQRFPPFYLKQKNEIIYHHLVTVYFFHYHSKRGLHTAKLNTRKLWSFIALMYVLLLMFLIKNIYLRFKQPAPLHSLPKQLLASRCFHILCVLFTLLRSWKIYSFGIQRNIIQDLLSRNEYIQCGRY